MATEGATLPEFATPSTLIDGPLKNCLIGWGGYMLGKTTEDTNILYDDDVKDIIYSQDGTKAADHVITGQLMMVNATFAELKTSLLAKMKFGITRNTAGGEAANLGFGRYTYTSLRQNKADVLRIYATDSNGIPSTDDADVINIYKAVPIIQDNLINWGADSQTNLPVQFMCYFTRFDGVEYTQVSGGPAGSFGYLGSATDNKMPAANWTAVSGEPVLLGAEATANDTITLTFAASVSEQGGADYESIVAWVDGVAVLATALPASAGATQAITFPASSFSAGDAVKVTIGASVFESTSGAVVFNGAVNYIVTNNLT